ncbi:hypothetical protein ACSQ6I_06615 [Anabaena sp. WFMT]
MTFDSVACFRAATDYSGDRLSEVQKPHPQPPHRLRGGGYDVPHVMRNAI